MDNQIKTLNTKLVQIFNDVRSIEEKELKFELSSNLNLRDIHAIDAISLGRNKTVSQVAQLMQLTPSSMTSVIDKLVKNEYVIRLQSTSDRRLVQLALTVKGAEIYTAHKNFHLKMCEFLLRGLSDIEVEIILQAVDNLNDFLEKLHMSNKVE